MEEFEDDIFDENMLASCNFFDTEMQELIQLQTEWINIVNFRELDKCYEELKPLIDAIAEFDSKNPVSEIREKWPIYEIFDDGRGPLIIAFLFRNILNKYNSDGRVNEIDNEPEYVYPMIIAKVYDINVTYYEPIQNDIHQWLKEKYEFLLQKANVD